MRGSKQKKLYNILTFFFPFFPGSPLVGDRHITETRIFIDLLGERVEKNASCFIHDQTECVGIVAPALLL